MMCYTRKMECYPREFLLLETALEDHKNPKQATSNIPLDPLTLPGMAPAVAAYQVSFFSSLPGCLAHACTPCA